MISSDQELLERWASRRDAAAFKDLTKRHAGMVFATCRRILGNDADAEDVAQECFVALVRAGGGPGGHLGPWLHRVATHLSLNWIRTEKRRRRRELAHAPTLSAAGPRPAREVLAHVDEAVADLPEELRVPIVAYFFEDQSQSVIAEALGLTRQGAAYRIQSGVESIRKALRRQGVTASAATLNALLAKEAAASPPASLSAELGKLALQGPLTAGRATATAKSLTGFLAVNGKAVVSAGLILLLVLAGAFLLLRHQSPSSPSPPPPLPVAASPSSDPEPPSMPQEDEAAALSRSDVPDVPEEKGAAVAPTASLVQVKRESPAEVPKQGVTTTVHGYVHDEGAFPIPGALISMVATGAWNAIFDEYALGAPNPMRTAVTDSDGLFRIESVPVQHNAYLSASAMGYRTASKKISLRDGTVNNEIGFVLTQGVMLNGIVLTDYDVPIPGAVVSPLGAAEPRGSGSGGGYIENIAVTDIEGAFAIGFRDIGMAALKVYAPDHGEALFTGLPVGQEEPVELRLGPAPSLSGTITHEGGSPAQGVQVALVGRFSMAWTSPSGELKPLAGNTDRRRAKTDSAGRYEFPRLVAHAQYSAHVETAKEWKALSFETDLGTFESGDRQVWDHVLRPMIRVFGTVTGAQTGRPIKDIRISYVKDGESTAGPQLYHNNRYELRLFEAATYYIFPEYSEYAREMTKDLYGTEVALAMGEEREINFELPDPFTLSIRVIDRQGQPIQGATADWLRMAPMGPGMYGSGETGEDGQYSNDFFPELESKFYVHKAGYTSAHSTAITGEPGQSYPEETIVLHQMGAVEGVVVDAQGRPLSHTELKIALRAEGVSVSHQPWIDDDALVTTTGADGAFAIGDGLPAVVGDVHISIHLDNNEWVELGVVESVEVLTHHVAQLGTLVFVEP